MDNHSAPPQVRELLYFFNAEGGPSREVVGLLGENEVGITLLQAWRTALFGGLLPHKLKELVRLRLTALDPECSPRGRREGITDEMLGQLPAYGSSPLFSNREKVALQYAEWFEADEVDGDSVFETLRTALDDEEIIELGKFCALIVGMERFLATVIR